MITLRPSAERGHFRSDWLDSRHTFSFDTYYHPRHMGFRALRVINEDWVQPGHGFPLHRHADMEIITYVVAGTLQHEDDLGHAGVIGPGEMQRITAGTGIRHSEYNPSDKEIVHLLQIWILPEREGLTPSYEQKRFPETERPGLHLLASAHGKDGSLTVHQDVTLAGGFLAPQQVLEFTLGSGRHAWIQVISGALDLNGQTLSAGDGAAVSEEENFGLKATESSRFLLFDLA